LNKCGANRKYRHGHENRLSFPANSQKYFKHFRSHTLLAPEITYLTSIFFRPGATSLLPELLNQQGIANPLVITDKGLVALGLVEKL
jgi:hypothetical protein